MRFRKFIINQWSEALSLDKARNVRKSNKVAWKQQRGLGKGHRSIKKFKPGTFGVEIEFKTELVIDTESLKNDIVEMVKEALQERNRLDRYSNYRPESVGLKALVDKFTEWEPEYYDEHFDGRYPEDPDDWEYENEQPEEPDREDYDNEEEYKSDWDLWKEEFDEWEEEKAIVTKVWNKYEENDGYDGIIEAFAKKIVEDEDYHDYGIYPEEYGSGGYDPEDKIQEYIDFLEDDLGVNTTSDLEGFENDFSSWYVHEDGTGIVEISSPILTSKDIPTLKALFNRMQYEETDGGTSCHVHIGMPENTDGFDLVAMTTLADEDSIRRDAGDRDYSSFAKFNEDIHRTLYSSLEDGVYEKEDFLAKVKSACGDRNKGTNISAFFDQGTVEFRYLSSEVIDTPDLVFQWVNYFLTLPHIAQGRKQLRIHVEYWATELVLTRLPNGAVEVRKDPEERVRQPQESPHDLRQSFDKSPFQRQKEDLLEKMAARKVARTSVTDVVQSNYSSNFYYDVRNAIAAYFEKLGKIPPNDPHLNNQANVYRLGRSIPMSEIMDKIHPQHVKKVVKQTAKSISQGYPSNYPNL